MSDDAKRVDEILDHLWTVWDSYDMGEAEFSGFEAELRSLHEATNDPRCLYALSELYHYRSKQARKKMGEFALQALDAGLDDFDVHDNFAYGNGMEFRDFKKCDHNELIEFYDEYIGGHPDSQAAHEWLVECLLDNYRLDEAEEIITAACGKFHKKRYYFDMYSGEALFRRGERRKAIECWQKACRDNPDEPFCFHLAANYYALFGMYDEAIETFERAFALRKPPRKIDPLVAIYRIHELREEYGKALETIARVKETYLSDWQVPDGDDEMIELLIAERRIKGKAGGGA